MKNHVQQKERVPAYQSKVTQIDQAVFFCYNTSSQRVPVGIVKHFTFCNNDSITFRATHLPVTEIQWQSFAGELHFYNKNIQDSLVLQGIGKVSLNEEVTVLFTIQHAVYNGKHIADTPGARALFVSLLKPSLAFYKKGSELLLQLFRRKTNSVFQ